jgi:hypothetical protein
MPRKPLNNRKDFLLLLLYSPGATDSINEPVMGRTRLTKMIFLFREEALAHFKSGTSVTEANFYQFFAWDFGPFSKDVYDDLLFFLLRDFIVAEATKGEEGLPEEAAEWNKWRTENNDVETNEDAPYFQPEFFRLTERGVEFTSGLYSQLSQNQQKLIKEFKSRTQRASLRALLQYVYKNYPAQIEKSKIREQILGHYMV